MAASSEQTRLLELFQLQGEQGPCLDCFHSGEPVSATDLATQSQRWPLFARAALNTGYRSVHALPLRLRQQILGALNLFGDKPGALSEPVARLGQALADMATITILHERALRESEHVAAQLQTALVSRIVIEQAKGVLAERGDLTMDDAFQVLRKHARDHNLRLHDVARGIVERTIDVNAMLGAPRRPQHT
jgi:GAF domain-containing protein